MSARAGGSVLRPRNLAVDRHVAENEFEFSENLSYRVARLHSLMAKATASIYVAEGLSSQQWKVMTVLHQFAPMPASEVQRWTVTLDKAAVSRTAQELLRKGLIDRVLRSIDARTVDIVLTLPGRELAARMTRKMAAFQAVLFQGISESEQAILFRLFGRIEEPLRIAAAADIAAL